jgi:arylsulfatase
VRRDHLTPYGYERDTTPAIDRLARGAVVFDSAYAQDTRTVPSHATMFTGVYPHRHGSKANDRLLAKDQITLAQILAGAGFRTGAFVSGLPMSRDLCGFERGFDLYEDDFSTLRRDGDATTRLALEWLEHRSSGEPFFLFLHLYDAHGPYNPRGPYVDLFHSDESGPILDTIPVYQIRKKADGEVERNLNTYVDRYDGLLRFLDDLVAAVLSELDLDDTAVVILSDHGETLGERFWKLDHGGQVFDEQIRIPLILQAPGLQPQRVDRIVETVDLLPTVLDLLGVPVPAGRPVQGKSLVPLLRGEPDGGREFTFATARAVDRRHADRNVLMDPKRQIRSVRSTRWKLVEYPGVEVDHLELYDLRADPEERVDVSEKHPGVQADCLEQLRRWGEGDVGDVGPSPHLDPELYEKLRALGYVG